MGADTIPNPPAADVARPSPFQPAGAGTPVILFDGVCNLCNASVQWVLRHDRRGAFRFASLQSRAGQDAIRSAGVDPAGLPDSLVLIDEAGVHTRSDAALRIAERLGFPWSIARAARVLPRGWRDGAYARVARNRYRWFGRRESCLLPTPALRARFLDADEPAPTRAPAASTGTDGLPERGGLFRSLLLRFVLAYLLVYILPFPLGEVPGTATVAGAYGDAWAAVVQWIAPNVFGVDATIRPAGSGDTTFNWVETALDLALAVVAAGTWTLLARGRPVSRRLLDVVQTYARYFLGITMLGYGWAKVMPMQFNFPGPERLLGTFGDASPMGLLWTFMGFSPAYQVFAGLAELVGGLLLLFRRTALAGALLCTGVLVNVVMLNFCYDVPVKLFSSHLLLISLFLLSPHAVRLLNVLIFNFPAAPVELRPFPYRSAWTRRAALAAKLFVVGYFGVWAGISGYRDLRTFGMFAPAPDWHGIYRVESFTRDGKQDRAVDDAQRWVRVALNHRGIGAVLRADGITRRQRMQVDLDKGTLTHGGNRAGTPPTVLRLAMPEAGVLAIDGDLDGAPVSIRLRKADDAPPFLTSRGFHWVNEFPMNR